MFNSSRCSFITSLMTVLLVFSLFIGVFAGYAAGQSTLRVGTETELPRGLTQSVIDGAILIAILAGIIVVIYIVYRWLHAVGERAMDAYRKSQSPYYTEEDEYKDDEVDYDIGLRWAIVLAAVLMGIVIAFLYVFVGLGSLMGEHFPIVNTIFEYFSSNPDALVFIGIIVAVILAILYVIWLKKHWGYVEWQQNRRSRRRQRGLC
jgi:MFS family permease